MNKFKLKIIENLLEQDICPINYLKMNSPITKKKHSLDNLIRKWN